MRDNSQFFPALKLYFQMQNSSTLSLGEQRGFLESDQVCLSQYIFLLAMLLGIKCVVYFILSRFFFNSGKWMLEPDKKL